jgi:hypothetical protein
MQYLIESVKRLTIYFPDLSCDLGKQCMQQGDSNSHCYVQSYGTIDEEVSRAEYWSIRYNERHAHSD